MPRLSKNGGDQTLLRKGNLTAVLNNVRIYKPLSRTELADRTGLNKATITRLVRDLIAMGLIREAGTRSSSIGSPSILLELDPNAGYIIGVRLDVDCSMAILTDFSSSIIWHDDRKHNADDNQEFIKGHILDLINSAIEHVPDKQRPIMGLGLSLPGLVDEEKGTLVFAPNLKWHDFDFRGWLEQFFDFPIYGDNEANLAALGEIYFGAGRDCENVLYVNITYGVGAGLVIGQEIFSGNSGSAGEVGHMTIDPNGPLCNCGNRGCWETFVSIPAIFRRISNLMAEGNTSNLNSSEIVLSNHLSIPLVVEAAENGDRVASQVLHETAEFIGLGLANLINILNPKKIILGGYLRPAYQFMLPDIKTVVEKRALRRSWVDSDILVAQHGNEASLIGAIAMIYNHILNYPIKTMRIREDI